MHIKLKSKVLKIMKNFGIGATFNKTKYNKID